MAAAACSLQQKLSRALAGRHSAEPAADAGGGGGGGIGLITQDPGLPCRAARLRKWERKGAAPRCFSALENLGAAAVAGWGWGRGSRARSLVCAMALSKSSAKWSAHSRQSGICATMSARTLTLVCKRSHSTSVPASPFVRRHRCTGLFIHGVFEPQIG